MSFEWLQNWLSVLFIVVCVSYQGKILTHPPTAEIKKNWNGTLSKETRFLEKKKLFVFSFGVVEEDEEDLDDDYYGIKGGSVCNIWPTNYTCIHILSS